MLAHLASAAEVLKSDEDGRAFVGHTNSLAANRQLVASGDRQQLLLSDRNGLYATRGDNSQNTKDSERLKLSLLSLPLDLTS